MFSAGTALLLLVLRLSLPALDLTGAQDVTMVHRGAFTPQLNLVGSDTSIQELALTDADVQFLGITVDERECTFVVNAGAYCVLRSISV